MDLKTNGLKTWILLVKKLGQNSNVNLIPI